MEFSVGDKIHIEWNKSDLYAGVTKNPFKMEFKGTVHAITDFLLVIQGKHFKESFLLNDFERGKIWLKES